MRAVIIAHPGGPEVLKVHERPQPLFENNEVLIRVKAAGVNRPDVIQRKGLYPAPPGAPQGIPGLEVAGQIESVGADCTLFKEGDNVCALVSGGGYADYVAVPEGQCLHIPEGLTFIEAASLPETFFTVWSNVFDRGRLKPGESLLVHGGSSGIGVTAIQMAKAWGSTVFITAGSEEKCNACTALGADYAINYNTANFRDVIKSQTNGAGVDVVLDMVGGSYTVDNLDLLREEGRLVIINAMKGDEVKVKLMQVMRKRLTITGSTLRARDTAFKSSIARALEKNVWPWLESGKVKPVVFKTFPLEQAAEAHALMESSKHIGKIVLTCS
jgi:NADPH:quinone reductase